MRKVALILLTAPALLAAALACGSDPTAAPIATPAPTPTQAMMAA